MKPFARSERVSGHIQQVLADILKKNIKDPRLEMATITGVKMSRSILRHREAETAARKLPKVSIARVGM